MTCRSTHSTRHWGGGGGSRALESVEEEFTRLMEEVELPCELRTQKGQTWVATEAAIVDPCDVVLVVWQNSWQISGSVMGYVSFSFFMV